MDRHSQNQSNNPEKNKLIEKALRIGGYSFPQTIDEVAEFERLFGNTDILLPPELQDPCFLYAILDNNQEARAQKNNTFAMAARHGSSDLPDDIITKIIEDIKQESSKDFNSCI
jgi:hypothetical protein